MTQSTITIRVEPGLKKKFDELCEDFGLSVSAAINIFMKAVVREERIPFEIQSNKKDDYIRFMENVLTMRETAVKYGIQDMDLEEINAEIEASRKTEPES